MCGARPMPTNGHGTFPGEATRFLWHMHHQVALEAPKMGEMVMLRSELVNDLPPESAVDEATLEHLISSQGFRLAYVPEAMVYNHGPETLRDFIRQRRRIAAGHFWLRSVSGYTVSTMDSGRLVRITVGELLRRKPSKALYAIGTIGVEVISRALGYVDFHTNHNKHAIWKVSESTKAVLSDDLRDAYRAGQNIADKVA
jgi:hypothetical protein